MKSLLKIILICLLLSNCSANRYLLTDQEKEDRKFLIEKIKAAKANGEISSNKPIIVLDGKPYRYKHELKKGKLTISKSDIKKIDVLKKETGIRIYGDFAKNGVLLITTNIDNNDLAEDKKDENSFNNSNILFLVDGKEVTKTYAESISPNDIETIQVMKGIAAKKMYPDKNYDGVIIIEMKK